jgi:hypothetical protein
MLILLIVSFLTRNQTLFSGDRSIISDARLQRNFVVQVILTDKPISPNSAITTTGHLTTTNDHSNSISVELPNSSLIEQT